MSYIVEEFAPVAEPLLLADVKNFLKVPPGVQADDTFVQELIQSAREEVERHTGLSLVNKGYRQTLDSFPYYIDTIASTEAYPPSYYSGPRYATNLWNYSQMIKLLRSPLRQVSKIVYTDTNNTAQTLFPAFLSWQPLTEYSIGDEIEDTNGRLQVVTAVTEGDEDSTSMSGTVQPTWATVTGNPTVDSMITWTCKGPVPDAGDFVYDADSRPARIFPMPGLTWPPTLYVPNAVQIHFTAGFGNDGKNVPATLRRVMRLLISDGYFNRDLVVPGSIASNPAFVRILFSYKVHMFASTRG
jgi:hypothetical protein